jgi:hypothetical protein
MTNVWFEVALEDPGFLGCDAVSLCYCFLMLWRLCVHLKLQTMPGPLNPRSWKHFGHLKRTETLSQQYSVMSQGTWIVSYRCFTSLSSVEQNTSIPTVFSHLNIFDWATNLQSRLHSTDVNKQLGRSDHVAQSQLWQAALHNIQIDCAT